MCYNHLAGDMGIQIRITSYNVCYTKLLRNTLVVVTADHDHTMTINGYSAKGNDVLDLVKSGPDLTPATDIDGNTYTTLVFGNGPNRPDVRANLDSDTVTADDYLQETGVKLSSETVITSYSIHYTKLYEWG